MICSFLGDIFRVAWADIRYLQKNFIVIMITIMIVPLLYFISFGYGLGANVNEIEGVSYVAFVIPGIISLSTLTSCFSSTANKIMVQRRFYTSFDEIVLCPVSPAAVVFGKTAAGFIKGALCCVLLIILGLIMSDDMQLNLLLMVCILISCLVYSLLGVLAGFLVKGLPTMTLFNSLVIVPMTFLCGTVFSISSMPVIIQDVISVFPLTHSTSCIRAAALGWEFPLTSFVMIIVFGIVFFIISYYILIKGKV